MFNLFVYYIENGRKIPSSSSGNAARKDALERTCARRDLNCAGRSLTMMIPSEEGPNAEVRVSEVMVPLFVIIIYFIWFI